MTFGSCFGSYFQRMLPVLDQIERIDDVGKRGMHVHDVADDQRRALMTAQDPIERTSMRA